ncbi:MAG: histidine phosphatase family protein [Oculatellaceae cyanobacterium Prado106]|jgi:phosphohistidine phosphatase SixA|nr:histidine phosphatase family protein [Oculatellaceae cyanobacterium Prado106]
MFHFQQGYSRRKVLQVAGLTAASTVLAMACTPNTASTPSSTGSTTSTESPTSTQSPTLTESAGTTQANPDAAVAAGDIWSQLRQGTGYVLLFRHAVAPGTGDPPSFQLEDCATQRNLSEEGRQQAVRMGEVLRSQNIPISRVLSSQWCRCLDTARLMNVGEVEAFPMLNSFFQDRSRESPQTEQLRQFILENRDNAGVVVMVTHQVNMTAISGIVPESGAAIVMWAVSADQVEFVEQLKPL